MEQQQSRKNDTEINTIELLEKYKKFLDAGALTQEEFDTKKNDSFFGSYLTLDILALSVFQILPGN